MSETKTKSVKAGETNPLSEKEKQKVIKQAAKYYGKFMTALQLDWENDPNSKETPLRVAKSFVQELWSGMFNQPPKITDFDNVAKYQGMVFQGDIKVTSMCSHHHLLFVGKAHVAYIPGSHGEDGNKIIGLSKLNRVVEYFARRPQVQENLTQQIHDYLDDLIKGNKGIAVVIEANHTCASCRGVGHDSTMKTSVLTGYFLNDEKARNEFYHFVSDLK